MFNDAVGFKKIFLKVGYTDLRKGIPGLTAMIRESFGYDPYEKNVLFLFCGRKADRIKGLVFEGDGFCLVYKRLSTNSRFQWPRSEDELKEITPQQFKWLMEGLTKEKDKGTGNTAGVSFMIVHYVENKSFLFVDKDSCPQEDLSFYWDLGLSLENCG